ncbi:hypothetical protein BH20ACT13_BH20ACT13_05220 [soil metagenome]
MVLMPYIRQSRPGERDVSFGQQWDAIDGWAKANGATLTVSSLGDAEDDGLVERKTSGARSWRERELGRIIEACQRKQASGVIVFDQSRLTREDLLGTAEVWDALEKAKADLVDATGGGKVNRMQYVLKAEMNRQQWEAARDRGNDTRRRHVAAGIHGGARVPFGYRRDDDRSFVFDEHEAEGVRFCFMSRARDVSWHSIAAEMDERWPVEGSWTPQRLQHMVSSDVYLGVARSGEYGNREAHELIVSRAQWEAAQSNGDRREWRGTPRLLSGIARCATCGYALRKDYTRPDFARYACGKRKAGAVCECPVTIGSDRLDEYITESFLDRLRSEPVSIGATPAGDDVVDAVRELEEAEVELEAYISTNLASTVGVEVFQTGATKRADAVNAARARVAELQRLQPAVALTTSVIDEWPSLTVEERRSLMSAAIQAVLVSPALGRGSRRPVGERVRIVWLGEDLPDLPGLTG